MLSSRTYLISLSIIYGASGMTALAYEVLWARMFSIQFGVSIFGVVITVSAFMAGLGIGGLAGLNWRKRIKSPLKIFALFELIIAFLALITPWLLLQLEGFYSYVAASYSLYIWYFVHFSSIGVLLFIPAFLMGAGFPMVLNAIDNKPHALGLVYGINTIGAAFGAVLPLILLPLLGWLSAMQFVAIVGLVISVAALMLSMFYGRNVDAAAETNGTDSVIKFKYLFAYAGIGAAALILEIGWTRLFGMIMLRTEYVLAVILAVYLFGVGAGSLLARYMKHSLWYNVLPVLAGLFVVCGLWFVPIAGGWVDYDYADSLANVLFQQSVILVLLTFPVTLILGAWLPLLNKKSGNTHHSGVRLYAVNSIGAAVGALVSGFLLTSTIGTSATIVAAGIMLFLLGITWAESKRLWLAVPVLVVVSIPVMSMPDVAGLLPKQYANSKDVFYFEDAVNITHVIEQADGQRILLADLQRMDASSDPTSVEVQKNQARLPLLLHHNPKSVLFLGVGTGISAAGSLAYPQLMRTAVELSQGAIYAAETWFSPVNDGVLQQLQLHRDDARRFLMASNDLYDVIIGDLFHPDLVGRSALLSVQQFQRARQHLASEGVFVQWLALNQFDVNSLEIVLRSFKQVFPNAQLFVDAFRIALVGFENQYRGAAATLQNVARLGDNSGNATGNEGVWTWLGRYWGPINVAEGKVQDEWAPVIEYRLPQARYSGQLDLAVLLNHLLQLRPGLDDAVTQLQVTDQHVAAFGRAYSATGLAHSSWLAYLTKQNQKAEKTLQLAYQANPQDRWIGFAIADGALANLDADFKKQYDQKRVLESILRIRPDHTEVLTRLWRMEAEFGNTDKAQQYRQQLANLSPLSKHLANP